MEREESPEDASGPADAPDETEASEWRFEAEQFDADVERVEMDADHEGERRGSVAGGNDRGLPVEPESVNLENALFVLLGIVATLAVFAQFVVG